jgi:transcriptional regulator with XRE-family HTH domain
MAGKIPDSVDKIIGRNVRVYRLAKGLSQTEVADQLGISFQQLQKYENGKNRIGSGRLVKIAGVLHVDITTLFEGCSRSKQHKTGGAFDELANRDSFRLVQAFAAIEDRKVRRSLVEFVESMVKAK